MSRLFRLVFAFALLLGVLVGFPAAARAQFNNPNVECASGGPTQTHSLQHSEGQTYYQINIRAVAHCHPILWDADVEIYMNFNVEDVTFGIIYHTSSAHYSSRVPMYKGLDFLISASQHIPQSKCGPGHYWDIGGIANYRFRKHGTSNWSAWDTYMPDYTYGPRFKLC